MKRNIIFIPLASLKQGNDGHLLELVADRIGLAYFRRPDTDSLRSYGLGVAIDSAMSAISSLPLTLFNKLKSYFVGGNKYMYLVNPKSNLTNAKGASLAIAIGLLVEEGYHARIIALGELTDTGLLKNVCCVQVRRMMDSAKSLGYQEAPTLFLLPSMLQTGYNVSTILAPEIAELRNYNIHVHPVDDLREALRRAVVGQTDE